jgi:hypothetical protein
MIVRPDDGAEAAPAPPQPARLRLAQIEEAMADALPAKIGQQHRLAAIEDVAQLETRRREGGGEFPRMVFHRCTGDRADQPVAVTRTCDDGVSAVDIGAQIAPLVIHVAIINIGLVAEDGDAQPGKVRQRGLQLILGQRGDGQRHGGRSLPLAAGNMPAKRAGKRPALRHRSCAANGSRDTPRA